MHRENVQCRLDAGDVREAGRAVGVSGLDGALDCAGDERVKSVDEQRSSARRLDAMNQGLTLLDLLDFVSAGTAVLVCDDEEVAALDCKAYASRRLI